MLKRILGAINTINETVTVTPITATNAVGRVGGITTIMEDGEGGIEDHTTIMIAIIRRVTHMIHTMIARTMADILRGRISPVVNFA